MARRASPAKMVPSVAPTFEHQPDLRALPVLAAIPAGHLTFPVPDEAFHPHLRRGEFAVVDLADHQPAHGELFVIAFEAWNLDCGRAHLLVEARSQSAYFGRPKGWDNCGPGFCFGPAEGFEPCTCWSVAGWSASASAAGREARSRDGVMRLSEGPFRTEALARKLVGRVVGVFVPAIGSTRGPGSGA